MNLIFKSSDKFSCDKISNFVIEITQACNFRCKYCCYSDNYKRIRNHSSRKMNKRTIGMLVNFIKNYADDVNGFVVNFYGGEALLERTNIFRIIHELSSYFGDKVSFDISSNGYNLNKEIIYFILKYNVSLSVSLDGIRDIHDRNRRTITDKNTYDTIISNLYLFKSINPEEYNKRIRILITAESLKDIEVMNYNYPRLKDLLGVKPLLVSRVIPNSKFKAYIIDDEVFENKFYQTALSHKKNGIEDLFTIVLDNLLSKNKPKLIHSSSCGIINNRTCLNEIVSLFIDVDGNLYLCEKMGNNFCIGNIEKGLNLSMMKRLSILYNIRRTLLCSSCEYVMYCSRCIADMKMSYQEQREVCSLYKHNISLSNKINRITNA